MRRSNNFGGVLLNISCLKEINNLLSDTDIKIPVWEKLNLTIEEAAAYSNIGINKIREISNKDNCPFVLWVGNKRLIKRRKFDEFMEKQFSI